MPASVLFRQKAVEPRDHLVVIRPPTPNDGVFVKKITRLTVGAISIFVQLRVVRKIVVQHCFSFERVKYIT